MTRNLAESLLPDSSVHVGVPDPEPFTDRAMTLAIMEQLTDRAVSALRPGDRLTQLPHPLVTDRNLGHYLDHASHSHTRLRAATSGPARTVLQPAAVHQANLAEAMIHCLHQLDHRTQQQDQRIRELEADLAEAHRRIGSLEGERR
ncbi:MAG: hypothetical protein AAF531_08580 [Actinomycetota bacterium]